MASTTSDSLPSSPSLPGTGVDQEFSSVDHHGLFLPSSSSPASMYFDHDSSFHGFLQSSSSTHMSPSPAPALPPQPPAPSKLPKKRPRASRRPPTTVLTTDTSNFRAVVQEFTGFPAPPFATGPPPSVRPRLLGGASGLGPPFLLRPSPLKYPHNPVLLPSTCATATTTTLANTATAAAGGTSSLVDALALFARSNVMMPSAAAAATAGGSSAHHHDQYASHHHGMGGSLFNPFDDFEAAVAAAAAEGEKANGGHGFFSSLGGGGGGAGDKYERH